jgi:hypothetical protein
MTNIIKDLGDGLHLKAGTLEDVERLSDYNARYLSDDGPDKPVEFIRHWTRDLMENHPTATPGDFTYVEDNKTGQIVSSLVLISQTWAYEDIPFGVGRVEMVSTHRDYRHKGLIRAQFEVFHEGSKARGEKLTAITGIPYFYRQFGYEMTINLGGYRRGYKPHIPKLKEDETEPFNIRPATPEDIPTIAELYERGRKRNLITCLRDERIWRYEMLEQHESTRSDMSMIESPDGESVGFIWHYNQLRNSNLSVFSYELKPGVSWTAVTPNVIRHLQAKGEEFASQDEEKEWESYTFALGDEHPAYNGAEKYLPQYEPPYAWYIRIPDLVDFLQHVTPVLNRRLGESEFNSYSGELRLDFHRTGINLEIETGEITLVESWQPSTEDRGDVAFKDLTFLQVLTGYRSFEALRNFFPDCYTGKKPESPALVKALFPKKSSYILGIM